MPGMQNISNNSQHGFAIYATFLSLQRLLATFLLIFLLLDFLALSNTQEKENQ